MEENNFILVSLDDDRSKDLADVLSNKTCKKVINLLIEKKSASAKDISDELGIGMSNVDYSIKKLLKSGLVLKDKNFFWSKKGKKIVMYKVSNKSIVISPKKEISSKLRNLIPSAMLIIASTFAVYVYEKIKGSSEIFMNAERAAPNLMKEYSSNMVATSEIIRNGGPYLWTWFLFGAVLVLIIFSILNWKKL